MYTSTTAHSSQSIKAWRHPSDSGAIWFGHPGLTVTSLSHAETQQLIAELQRELAAVEAEARGAAA
jgi:hypothetical protein